MLDQVRSILHRLEKLSLTGQLNKIFEFFRRDLTNLKSLTLKRLAFRDGWTRVFPSELSKITELRSIDVILREDINKFESFLDQLSNLQVFVHLRRNCDYPGPEEIANCLYRHFPHLKGIGCNLYFNQRRTYSIGNRFSFLKNFTSLTEIHFKCFHAPADIHDIIKFVPNVKVLSMIRVIQLYQPPAAVRLIRKTIQEIIDQRRGRFPPNDRVHLIVNKELYREFIAIKSTTRNIH